MQGTLVVYDTINFFFYQNGFPRARYVSPPWCLPATWELSDHATHAGMCTKMTECEIATTDNRVGSKDSDDNIVQQRRLQQVRTLMNIILCDCDNNMKIFALCLNICFPLHHI